MLNIFKNIFNRKTKSQAQWSEELMRMIEFNNGYAENINAPYKQSYVVYSAVRTICNTASQVPLRFYDGKNDIVTQGDVVDLFQSPNEVQSFFELLESVLGYLNLTGEAFIYMPQSIGQALNTYQLPSLLQSLSPKHMTHKKNSQGMIDEWVFNERVLINPLEIIHIKLFNPYNSLRGLSPLTCAMNILQSDNYAEQWNKSFFKNSAMPSSVLTIDKDQEVNDAVLRKLHKQLKDTYQGTKKAHLPMVLSGGMDWKTLSITHKEMDFLNSKKLSRDNILSILGVPPFVAGFTDKGDTNRATADAASYIFYTNTIIPLLHRISQSIQRGFNIRFNTGLTCKFDFSDVAVLKRDYSQRVKDATQLINYGFSRNEVVDRLDLGFDDVDDDIRYIPMNLIPTDVSNDNKDKNIKSKSFNSSYYRYYKSLHNAHERVFNSKLRRFFFSQRSDILKIIENKNINSSNTTTKDYMDVYNALQDYWSNQDDELIDKVKPIFQNIHKDSIDLANSIVPGSIPIDYSIVTSKANKIVDINQTTWNDLREALYNGFSSGENINDISTRIKKVFNVATKRALVIARTETTSMINETTFKHYDNEGVSYKTWVGGERPTHAAQNGMTIPINQRFPNGLLYPGDDGPASEVVNCRCCLAPSIQGV